MTAHLPPFSPRRQLVAAFALVGAVGWMPPDAAAEPMHGIAMQGLPDMPADFTHLPYANPDAPKGGKITYGVVGTFDSLNPLIVQGGATSARGLSDPVFGRLVFESLLFRSADEPFTLYGLIAETIEVPDDRSWVEFTVNPKARFADGTPITAEDVIFSLELLRTKGRPNYRYYYGKVDEIEKVGKYGVRYNIADANDRELPLILGLMPILPKHAIDTETFDKSTLTPILGSGPYIPTEIDAPDHIVYKRNPDYWAKDLPIKRGFDNYDEIRVEYYRDVNTMFEAFKKGLFDVHLEGDPARWSSGYDFPALTDGRVVRETFVPGTPKGMSGFVFNTRRPKFADIRVRRALSKLFDFDWVNENLYYGVFVRAAGYFNNSDLSSIGQPASARERELLAAFPGVVSDDVMAGTYRPLTSGEASGNRAVLAEALAELREAGYELQGNDLVNVASGEPLTFEIMVVNKADERLALAFQRTLERVGVKVSVRNVDSSQYQKRRQTFDFDVFRFTWGASLSPGNEQSFRWGQAAADQEGTFNYPGAREPAIDAMIAAMLAARSREDFVAAVRAFDRVLISQHYAVPLFYLPERWLARWDTVRRPDTSPVRGYSLPTWWAASAE